MIRKAYVFLALIICTLGCYGQNGKGGLISGDGWALLVSAPQGWVWDSVALRSQGIWGLFYQEGASFSPSKLHIYIDPVAKNPGGPATLAEFIARDEAEYMSSDPNLSIKDIAPYLPGLDYRFTMREFDDSANNYYQALAFYEGEKAYFVIVLSCRSPSERDENRGALLELLDSFTYIQEE